MTVPSSASFVFDLDRLISHAWSRIQRIVQRKQSGEEFQDAVECFGLLCQDIDLKGPNLWAIDEGMGLSLTVGDKDYALGADTIDLLDLRLVDPSFGSDTVRLTRMSRDQYRDVSDRDTTGRPLQYWLNRRRDTPILHLWPIPEKAGYMLKYDRIRRIKDGTSPLDDLDFPPRWMPALTSGMAFFMAQVTQGVPSDEVDRFEARYDKDYATASAEDAEDVPLRLVADISGYTRV